MFFLGFGGLPPEPFFCARKKQNGTGQRKTPGRYGLPGALCESDGCPQHNGGQRRDALPAVTARRYSNLLLGTRFGAELGVASVADEAVRAKFNVPGSKHLPVGKLLKHIGVIHAAREKERYRLTGKIFDDEVFHGILQ